MGGSDTCVGGRSKIPSPENELWLPSHWNCKGKSIFPPFHIYLRGTVKASFLSRLTPSPYSVDLKEAFPLISTLQEGCVIGLGIPPHICLVQEIHINMCCNRYGPFRAEIEPCDAGTSTASFRGFVHAPMKSQVTPRVSDRN